MKKRGKRFQDAVAVMDTDKAHSLEEAVDVLKETSKVKFDETVELHLRTSADPRHADQLVRGVTMLPHGLGKTVRVLVFANGEAADIAKRAGADFIGDDDLIRNIEGGWVDFDIGLAIPDMMSKIGKLGRVLGRRGLMPNPRTGTMVQPQDLPRTIEEAKKGRVEYRMDRTGLIHVSVGKVSFSQEQLVENVASIVDAIVKSKPSGVKGTFIRTAFLTSTMGPSIKLDVNALLSVKVE
ncbi:MAG: 50S ribosomal protein L1 [Dehalococcoidia bacterium]|nr:50S ribosomal protein L1 [Chloroflexota bacterium]MCZ6865944.1 50S ribosomal protein L1 [Chloroflexota bacterium]